MLLGACREEQTGAAQSINAADAQAIAVQSSRAAKIQSNGIKTIESKQPIQHHSSSVTPQQEQNGSTTQDVAEARELALEGCSGQSMGSRAGH
jgi:hypothetical protein